VPLAGWVRRVYQEIAGSSLDVGMNDQTRALFDRLVAGDQNERRTNLPSGVNPDVSPGGSQPAQERPPSTDRSQPLKQKEGLAQATLGKTTLGLTTTAPPGTAKESVTGSESMPGTVTQTGKEATTKEDAGTRGRGEQKRVAGQFE